MVNNAGLHSLNAEAQGEEEASKGESKSSLTGYVRYAGDADMEQGGQGEAVSAAPPGSVGCHMQYRDL
jgi:hypothetical protein